MPTITVTDKLFVHKAIIRVGIIAVSTLQSIDINDDLSLMIKLSTISAVKIQIGIYESHLITVFGSSIFLITKKGIILGTKVTMAHPKMINKMDKLILICLLPLQ
jgi:hypothetical protein